MQNPQELLPLVPLLPLAGALVNGLFGARLPRALVGFIACAAVLASALLAGVAFAALTAGTPRLSTTLYHWLAVGGLRVDVSFTFDHLSGLMTLVVTGVGFLIHLYSLGYMAHEASLARYFAYLNLFTFAMLVLVLGDSLPLMFVGWEGVGLCSYLLIGFWYEDDAKAAAGKKAFIVNRVGDFGFISAMLVLFRVAGTLDFAGLQTAAATGAISTTVATGVCLLLVLGATGKSAQLPLYVWLPDAMAGPTPVSALIHAATMVTAGVYLTARLAFLFNLAPAALLTLACIGAATALLAATIATAQNDVKKVLAYSTVSQLGFMFIAAGVGAYGVAIFHVVTHAFFKACLFLGAGSVIHGMSGEQDMRQLGGLWRKMPLTAATFIAATLAITGLPLTAGFISKDAILWSAFSADLGRHAASVGGVAKALWLVAVLTAGLTAFYMWRLVFLTFFSGKSRAAPVLQAQAHESPRMMTLPLVVLALASLVGGALGWPHVLGGHDWLGRWLGAVVGVGTGIEGDHRGAELALMAVATTVAAAGFAAAWFLYGKAIHPVTHRLASAGATGWLYQRVLGKWHIDELYDAVVVRPIAWSARVLLYEGIDRRLIDGLVNLVAFTARTVGMVGQLFQSGNVQRYIAVFTIAVALLLYGWLTPFAGEVGSPVAPEPPPQGRLQPPADPPVVAIDARGAP